MAEISSLPQELIAEIIGHLDTASYFERRLQRDPELTIDDIGNQSGPEVTYDLKNVSLVCRSWRQIALPALFRHLRFIIQGSLPCLFKFTNFMKRYEMRFTVETITIIVPRSCNKIFERHNTDTHHRRIYWVPDIVCCPSTKLHFLDNDAYWQEMFCHISPWRLTFIGHPFRISELLGRFTGGGETQCPRPLRYQLLSLSRYFLVKKHRHGVFGDSDIEDEDMDSDEKICFDSDIDDEAMEDEDMYDEDFEDEDEDEFDSNMDDENIYGYGGYFEDEDEDDYDDMPGVLMGTLRDGRPTRADNDHEACAERGECCCFENFKCEAFVIRHWHTILVNEGAYAQENLTTRLALNIDAEGFNPPSLLCMFTFPRPELSVETFIYVAVAPDEWRIETLLDQCLQVMAPTLFHIRIRGHPADPGKALTDKGELAISMREHMVFAWLSQVLSADSTGGYYGNLYAVHLHDKALDPVLKSMLLFGILGTKFSMERGQITRFNTDTDETREMIRDDTIRRLLSLQDPDDILEEFMEREHDGEAMFEEYREVVERMIEDE